MALLESSSGYRRLFPNALTNRRVAVFLAIALPASCAPKAVLTAPVVPTIAGCKMFPDTRSPLGGV